MNASAALHQLLSEYDPGPAGYAAPREPLGPGVHRLSADLYHADPCERPSLSSSLAKLLCTGSPAHARIAHPRLNPDYEHVDEDKFAIGTASHALLLEGESVVEVIDAPDWRKDATKEARDEVKKAGRIPLLAKDWARVQAMADAARAQLAMYNVTPRPLADGKAEQTLIWEEGDVLCRARADWLHHDLSAIDDFKTTAASADPREWGRRTMFTIGADIQVAFYLRGLRALSGKKAQFRFIVQENSPPFVLSMITPSENVLALANAKVEHAIGIWRKCLAAGVWPAYGTEIHEAELPSWEDTRWANREQGDA